MITQEIHCGMKTMLTFFHVGMGGWKQYETVFGILIT